MGPKSIHIITEIVAVHEYVNTVTNLVVCINIILMFRDRITDYMYRVVIWLLELYKLTHSSIGTQSIIDYHYP